MSRQDEKFIRRKFFHLAAHCFPLGSSEIIGPDETGVAWLWRRFRAGLPIRTFEVREFSAELVDLNNAVFRTIFCSIHAFRNK
jgi:hypothetical protein